MKINNAKITILVGEEGTTITLLDGDSNTSFAEVTLTPVQLSQALSRLAHTKCEIEVHNLERVGRTMEHQEFEFELPPNNNRREAAKKIVLALCPKGWTPSTYFGSQNSFFYRDDKTFARTTIRRWV